MNSKRGHALVTFRLQVTMVVFVLRLRDLSAGIKKTLKDFKHTIPCVLNFLFSA